MEIGELTNIFENVFVCQTFKIKAQNCKMFKHSFYCVIVTISKF